MLGTIICSPNINEVLPLPPVFVTPQEDNNKKQDTECKAFKRILHDLYDKTKDLNPIILADAIYGHQPMINCLHQFPGLNFIITCKEGSQKNIFDFINGAKLDTITVIKKINGQKFKLIYSYMNNIPLINQYDSVNVNYIELTEIKIHSKDHIDNINSILAKRSRFKQYNIAYYTHKFSFITDI
jgi:hypothetical protein